MRCCVIAKLKKLSRAQLCVIMVLKLHISKVTNVYLLVAGGVHERVPEVGVVYLDAHHGCRGLPTLPLEDGVGSRHLNKKACKKCATLFVR